MLVGIEIRILRPDGVHVVLVEEGEELLLDELDALAHGVDVVGLIHDCHCTLEIIDKRKPEALAIEKLFYANNAKTVIGVAEARGVILLAAQLKGIPIFEYTPLQVKQAVTGYGQALKPQMQEMTRRLLCLREIPKPDDTADALAIAICHGQNCTVKRRLPKTYYYQKN